MLAELHLHQEKPKASEVPDRSEYTTVNWNRRNSVSSPDPHKPQPASLRNKSAALDPNSSSRAPPGEFTFPLLGGRVVRNTRCRDSDQTLQRSEVQRSGITNALVAQAPLARPGLSFRNLHHSRLRGLSPALTSGRAALPRMVVVMGEKLCKTTVPRLPREGNVHHRCGPHPKEPPGQPSRSRWVPAGVALRDSRTSPIRSAAPLGHRQGWRFRSFRYLRARRKQGRLLGERRLPSGGADARVASACIPFLPGGPASVPSPRRLPVPPGPHRAELRAPGSYTAPRNSRASLAPSSGRRSLPAPRLLQFHLGLREPPPRAPPPGPARPGSQPGSPASCAATAARDPPPSRLPLSCLFRSTNNFGSDAGSLGPRRPLLPAPPSGYENSKQLADLRADQLRLPPTPHAAPALQRLLRFHSALGWGRGWLLREGVSPIEKGPLHAPSLPPKDHPVQLASEWQPSPAVRSHLKEGRHPLERTAL
ncbi:uncharacterized protein LOC144371594 [Ictidomys tridecemlineatus]